MAITISTDRLISATEARRNLGKLLSEVSEDVGHYYVILDGGKISAALVNEQWLEKTPFPDLKALRSPWRRRQTIITAALKNLEKKKKKDLPPLLR